MDDNLLGISTDRICSEDRIGQLPALASNPCRPCGPASLDSETLETMQGGKREEAAMNTDVIAGGPVLVCADCGVHFRARRVTDGVEELCNDCYEARFPTVPALRARREQNAWRDQLAAD
jgi:hypothetical protein